MVCKLSCSRARTGLTGSSVVFAVSLLASLSAGYALGAWSSHAKSPEPKAPAAAKPDASTKAQDESDSDEEEVADGDLSAVKPGVFENCKLVRDTHVFLAKTIL